MKADHFYQDIKDFLVLLNKHKVRYVIVSGEAVIYYGFARLTGDVDFYYGFNGENPDYLYDALQEFWGEEIPGVKSVEDLKAEGYFIQFGVPPNRIDMINKIDNVSFEEAWTNRKTEQLILGSETVSVHFIGLEQLIKNKEFVKRHKDLEDLRHLKKLLKN